MTDSLMSNLSLMEHQAGNPVRQEVAYKVKQRLAEIKGTGDDKNALGTLEAFVTENAQKAGSDIERITFIEVLDMINRRV